MFVLETDGKVRACFSNKISTVTHKVVMFTLELSEGKFMTTRLFLLSRVYLGNTPSTDESHTKLETMMVDLAQQMTTVKHEQEYMEVRERIHTYVTPYRYHMNL